MVNSSLVVQAAELAVSAVLYLDNLVGSGNLLFEPSTLVYLDRSRNLFCFEHYQIYVRRG